MTEASAYLKARTHKAHTATEKLLLGGDLRRQSVSLARYQRLILTTARVWAGAREAFRTAPAATRPYREVTDSLSDAARRDVRVLQLTGKPAAATFPAVSAAPEAWGSMYVLIGSTLGGRVIARLLRQCPDLAALPAFHFYSACAELPKTLWPEFRKGLNAAIQSQSALERCARQAELTFGLYPEYYG